MKTYKIELSTQPLKQGCLTSRGIIKELVKLRFGERYLLHTGTQEGGIYLKHLKCYERRDHPFENTYGLTQITDPAELQKIWEAIRGEEPKKEWRLAHLDWQNFTLKEGTYQVESDYVPDNNGCISIKDRDQQLIKILSPIGTNIPDPTGEYSDLFAYLYDKISPLLKQK